MSDDASSTPEMTAAGEATNTEADASANADTDRTDRPPDVVDPSERSLRRGARWLGIGIAALVALVACVSLYSSVGTLITEWVAPRYQPLYEVAFDAVVLLVAAAAITRLARGTDVF